MTCQQIEKAVRRIVCWLLWIAVIIGVNCILIAFSLAEGTPWWVGHVWAIGVIGGGAGVIYLIMWIIGDISFCRKP